MKMIDYAELRRVRDLGLYLNKAESEHLVEELGRLLRDPAPKHVPCGDWHRSAEASDPGHEP